MSEFKGPNGTLFTFRHAEFGHVIVSQTPGVDGDAQVDVADLLAFADDVRREHGLTVGDGRPRAAVDLEARLAATQEMHVEMMGAASRAESALEEIRSLVAAVDEIEEEPYFLAAFDRIRDVLKKAKAP